jgi:hypothetical protein
MELIPGCKAGNIIKIGIIYRINRRETHDHFIMCRNSIFKKANSIPSL